MKLQKLLSYVRRAVDDYHMTDAVFCWLSIP